MWWEGHLGGVRLCLRLALHFEYLGNDESRANLAGGEYALQELGGKLDRVGCHGAGGLRLLSNGSVIFGLDAHFCEGG